MKNIYLTAIFIFFNLLAHSQNAPITGGFHVGTDYSGNQFVYFQGNNQTEYNLSVTVKCVNEQLNQQRTWPFTLIAGGSFSIGPGVGWTWQRGEKLYVYFPNGQSIYWVYGNSGRNLSFTGREGEFCTGDRHKCTCSGYKPRSRADWHCKNCDHVKSDHKF